MSEEARPTVPPNNIFIGKKPVTSYALAALMQLSAGFDEIVLKARGRAISKAVDVAEVLRNRFMKDELEVKSITIGTETAGTGEDIRNVSTIEIVLARKK